MFTVGRPPNLFELVCEGLMLSNEVTLDVSIAPLEEVTLLFCFWKGEKEDRFLLRVWNKSLMNNLSLETIVERTRRRWRSLQIESVLTESRWERAEDNGSVGM